MLQNALKNSGGMFVKIVQDSHSKTFKMNVLWKAHWPPNNHTQVSRGLKGTSSALCRSGHRICTLSPVVHSSPKLCHTLVSFKLLWIFARLFSPSEKHPRFHPVFICLNPTLFPLFYAQYVLLFITEQLCYFLEGRDQLYPRSSASSSVVGGDEDALHHRWTCYRLKAKSGPLPAIFFSFVF